MKSNIVQFKKKSISLNEFLCSIQISHLEDGSIWYRIVNTKNGEMGEWIKTDLTPDTYF